LGIWLARFNLTTWSRCAGGRWSAGYCQESAGAGCPASMR
jgi:hypothetical protein